MKVAILAGGQGTRMYPYTIQTPKILLSVKRRPFAEWQLLLLQRAKITEVVYCIGHLGHQIQDFLGDGSTYGMSFAYSDEGEERLGTGGAVKRALPLLGHEPFMTIYGDSFLDCHYRETIDHYHWAGKPCLRTLYQGVDYGLSIFHPWAFQPAMMPDRFDLPDLHAAIRTVDMLADLDMPRPFHEIGSRTGRARLEEALTIC